MLTAKRTIDVAGALIGMITLSPLYLIIYMLIKADDNGPAIYKQERIGLHGQPFKIRKFRTMTVNTEEDGIPQLAEENDKRLTPIGKFLREHHFDELPQLWNVFVGDMSFVGYRPERKYFIDKIMAVRPDYADLFAMRPGITSMATIHNGYTSTLEKMIRRLDMDLAYLHNHSLATDFKIVISTVFPIISGKKL